MMPAAAAWAATLIVMVALDLLWLGLSLIDMAWGTALSVAAAAAAGKLALDGLAGPIEP